MRISNAVSKQGGIGSAKAGVLAFLLLTACAGMTAIGSGCAAYAEQRLAMPRGVPLPDGPWGQWVADTDDRMTGACRG